MAAISDDDNDELFLSCRYGDVEDIQQFVSKFGPAPLSTLRDQNGNTILHMICGNGHVEALDYVLPLVIPDVLATQNSAKSTPLHWAALNSQLVIVQKLVDFPAGPGIDLIDIKNSVGRSPLGEAELAGWDEGAKWLVQMMRVDAMANPTEEDQSVEDDRSVDKGQDDSTRDIEVEIEDADGEIARYGNPE